MASWLCRRSLSYTSRVQTVHIFNILATRPRLHIALVAVLVKTRKTLRRIEGSGNSPDWIGRKRPEFPDLNLPDPNHALDEMLKEIMLPSWLSVRGPTSCNFLATWPVFSAPLGMGFREAA